MNPSPGTYAIPTKREPPWLTKMSHEKITQGKSLMVNRKRRLIFVGQ